MRLVEPPKSEEKTDNVVEFKQPQDESLAYLLMKLGEYANRAQAGEVKGVVFVVSLATGGAEFHTAGTVNVGQALFAMRGWELQQVARCFH